MPSQWKDHSWPVSALFVNERVQLSLRRHGKRVEISPSLSESPQCLSIVLLILIDLEVDTGWQAVVGGFIQVPMLSGV